MAGLNALAISLLVLIFGSILRRCASSHFLFWFVGWFFVLCDVLIRMFTVDGESPALAIVAMQLTALAGACFIAAVSGIVERIDGKSILAATVGVPLVAYGTGITLHVESNVYYYTCILVGSFASWYFIWHSSRKLSFSFVTVLAISVLATAIVIREISQVGIERGFHVAQGAVFALAGVLFLFKFHRSSVAAITSICGFVTWGISFFLSNPLGGTVYEVYGLELPKYLVALGMILTVLEEQVREVESASHQLAHLAHHDSLTNLPNRTLFEDRLSQTIARAQRVKNSMAVLCIDLARFKHVNDTFGHRLGDLYLKAVADRLSARVRATDTLARTGMDEFSIIVSDLKQADVAPKLANSLLETLSAPLIIEGCVLQPTAAIGVAVYPHDGGDIDSLCRAASRAMYRAKARGRNQVEAFSDETREMFDMAVALQTGLTKGGFELFYQPQVSLDGTISGLEALIRFRHPKLGLLPPGRFISIAEESGLIIPIGQWVLEEACRQAADWQTRLGFCPRISCNVSALQFAQSDFGTKVANTLKETGCPGNILELELTETLVMSNVRDSGEQMQLLKNLGVNISIDDFGTGYSSLSYLHELPIDTLKIDRSFIEKMLHAGGTKPIVEAIISLAASMNMRTIAEGVEDTKQFQVLAGFGCDAIQGYLFSHPLPASQMERVLSSGARLGVPRILSILPWSFEREFQEVAPALGRCQ